MVKYLIENDYNRCRKRPGCADCVAHRARNPLSPSFWKDLELPSRENNGALFFQPSEDPENPGHNKTYLQQLETLRENPKMSIHPDSDLDDGDPKRCQVKQI